MCQGISRDTIAHFGHITVTWYKLQDVSIRQHLDCLLSGVCLWTSKLRVTTLCEGTLPMTPLTKCESCLSHIQPRAPYDFYHPYDFLPVRPSEAPVGILRRFCSRGHIRLRAPYGFRTAVHLWFGRMIRRNPWVPHAVPVRASYGHRKGIFNVFHILRGPCGTRKGAVRHPYGHVRELIQPELTKLPHGRRIWPFGARTGPLWSPHRLFTGYLGSENPYGARKLIMHALKTAGPAREGKFVRRRTGPVRAPWVDVRFLFKTAREQPVRGPGVWCDWGIIEKHVRVVTSSWIPSDQQKHMGIFNSQSKLGPMLKSILINKHFQTWHLIGWQHRRQQIRSYVRKSLLTNIAFNMDFTCNLQPLKIILSYQCACWWHPR